MSDFGVNVLFSCSVRELSIYQYCYIRVRAAEAFGLFFVSFLKVQPSSWFCFLKFYIKLLMEVFVLVTVVYWFEDLQILVSYISFSCDFSQLHKNIKSRESGEAFCDSDDLISLNKYILSHQILP